jgi:hypothetical protein
MMVHTGLFSLVLMDYNTTAVDKWWINQKAADLFIGKTDVGVEFVNSLTVNITPTVPAGAQGRV